MAKKTVSAALTAYLEAGRANGLRPATLKWYTSLLAKLMGDDIQTYR